MTPDAIGEARYQRLMAAAREHNQAFDAIEREHGGTPPWDVAEHSFLGVVSAALECGIRLENWAPVAEALVMIEQREARS